MAAPSVGPEELTGTPFDLHRNERLRASATIPYLPDGETIESAGWEFWLWRGNSWNNVSDQFEAPGIEVAGQAVTGWIGPADPGSPPPGGRPYAVAVPVTYSSGEQGNPVYRLILRGAAS
jgi:hypothetical protein